MTTPKELQRFLTAQQAFGAVVESIGDGQWSDPTPCDQWDVRALVNHLVYEQVWAAPLVSGRTVEEVGDEFDGDLLGADPVGRWKQAAEESAAVFSAPNVLDRTVMTSMGESPTTQYLAEMTCDLIVHRWDLGQAIGDEQRFSADELEQVQAMADSLAPMREQIEAAGVFAAALPVAADADAQTRALAAMGRAG